MPERGPLIMGLGPLSHRRSDLLSAVLLLGFFAAAMTQASVPGLSSILREEAGLSASRVGLLMSAYFLSYGVLQVPAGALAARWGGRVALAGFAMLALGDIPFLTGSHFSLLLVARLGQGLGAAVMLPTAGSLSSRHISVQRLGRGWSITGMGAGIGNLFALTVLPWVASGIGLPVAFAVMLGLTVVSAAISARLPEMRQLPSSRLRSVAPLLVLRDIRTLLGSRAVRRLVVVNVAAISFGVGIVTWTPLYLHEVGGVPATISALVTAGYAVGQITAGPVMGLLTTRLGNFPVLVGAFLGMIACGIAFLFLHSPIPVLALAAAVGVFMISSFVSSYAMIPFYVELQHAGLTSGILSGIGFLGSLPTPWLVGVMLDAGWGYRVSYAFLTAFAVLGLLAALALRRVPIVHYAADVVGARLRRHIG